MNMMLSTSASGIVATHVHDDRSLGDTSFQYMVGALRPAVERHRWLHVSTRDHISGNTQQEEDVAIDIAQRELTNHGYSIPREQCRVLHVRELRYNPESPNQIQKSKIFLVLASPNILVSVSDEDVLSIPHCKRVFAERSDVGSFELAAAIIKEALLPVREVRMAFSRFLEPLSEHARRELLDDAQQTSLDKMKQASGYATMRLLDMQAGAIRQLTDLIDQSGLQATYQSTRATLLRLGAMLGVEVTAFQKIDSLIGDVRSAHRETLSRKLIEETEKNNQLQKEAENRKELSDTQWQILGGISVPIGLALGAIQAFQLSRGVGTLVLGLSSVVAAGLVYFRNDWFGWLYGPKSSPREMSVSHDFPTFLC